VTQRLGPSETRPTRLGRRGRRLHLFNWASIQRGPMPPAGRRAGRLNVVERERYHRRVRPRSTGRRTATRAPGQVASRVSCGIYQVGGRCGGAAEAGGAEEEITAVRHRESPLVAHETLAEGHVRLTCERASVRRHRRAPEAGSARNRLGTAPSWLMSDSQPPPLAPRLVDSSCCRPRLNGLCPLVSANLRAGGRERVRFPREREAGRGQS
jgi:hypothetical protein